MKLRIDIWLFIGWLPQGFVFLTNNETFLSMERSNINVNYSKVTNITSGITKNLHILLNNTAAYSKSPATKLHQGNATHVSNSSEPPILNACDQTPVNLSFHANQSCYPPSAALQCFHDPIFCKKHFTSGKRELQDERPKYGEYSSLKHQRWFHVIQHGGIAFLFHPCSAKEEVEKLRQVASQCLHRYVLAPYDKLTQSSPLALVSWGCFYLSNQVDASQMQAWIRKHAYSGPASHVHTNGKFEKNLVKQSSVITDAKDAILCPNEEEKNRFTPNARTAAPMTTMLIFTRNPESIINNRIMKLSNLKPSIEISANITVTKVETGSAVWAAASLIFLCGILVGWLLYTRQWSSSSGGYRYDPLRNKDSFECEPGQSQFNLLKSSQKFMSTFRLKESSEKKDDAMSKVKLMVPINEEEDEEEDVIFMRR